MDDDATAEPEPSGDALAPSPAAGVPRRALVASGESLLSPPRSDGPGTVTSGLPPVPPWQKRQRMMTEEFKRDTAVHEGVHSDLGDKWADTPGASLCASPELLQLCGGTGPAVVAPPANLGNPPSSDPAVLQQMQQEVLEFYRKLRVSTPHFDKVFAHFASSCVFSGRFVEEPKWGLLREELLVWKTDIACSPLVAGGESKKLSDLLEPWLGKLAEAENTSSSSTAPPTKQTC